MHPGANNSGHTLGKGAGHPDDGMAPASGYPDLPSLSLRTVLFLLFFLLSFIIASCTSTSPRFTSGGSRVSAAESTATGRGEDRRDRSGAGGAYGREENVLLPAASRENNPAIDRRKVLTEIMGMMGTPYSGAGSDSGGIDCSGFTAKVYRDAAGKEIPRSCREQFETGEPVDPGKLRFGDLVFFNIDGHQLSHVGIYVGDGLFAHASVSLGITVSVLDSEYYRRCYAGARRILR